MAAGRVLFGRSASCSRSNPSAPLGTPYRCLRPLPKLTAPFPLPPRASLLPIRALVSVELLRNVTPSKTPDVKDIFAPLAASAAAARGGPPPIEPAFNFDDAAAAVEEYLSDEDCSQSDGSAGPMRHSLSRDDLRCLHDMLGASDYDYEQSEASNAMEFLLDKAALPGETDSDISEATAGHVVVNSSWAVAEAEAVADAAREAAEREQMECHDPLLVGGGTSDMSDAIADTLRSNALTCRPEPDNIFRIRSNSHRVCEVSEGGEVAAQTETVLMRGEGGVEEGEGDVHDEGIHAAEIVVADAFVAGISESLEARRIRQRWAVAVADAMAVATENAVAAGEVVARFREEAEAEAAEVEAQRAAEANSAPPLLMSEEEAEEAGQLAITSAPPPVLRKTTPPPAEQAYTAVEPKRKAARDRKHATPTATTVAVPAVAGAMEGTAGATEARDVERTTEVVTPASQRVAKQGEAYEAFGVYDDAPVDAPEAGANALNRAPRDASQSNWGILARKLGADVFCAGAAAAAVSPFVGAIDKAVVESVSGSASIAQSMKASFAEMAAGGVRGVVAAPQFRYLFAMYTGTYATANTIRTVYEAREADPSLALCVGTTAVNAGLSLVKDKALAQIFGASASAAKGVPVTAYGWWLGRDAVTMGMVFTAPPKVSQLLQTNLGWSPNVADVTATLAIPMVIQPLTTGMHLLGIDLVNRPTNVSVAGRLDVLGKSYGESLAARTGRIFVPYSIGSLVNSKMRAFLHKASSSWSVLLPGARGTVVPSMAK